MRLRNRWWIALMALAVMSGRGEDYREQKILSPVPGVMFGRPVRVDGNTAVTIRAEDWGPGSKSEVVIMERGRSGWKITQTFPNDYPHIYRWFEVRGDEIFLQHEARIDIYKRIEGSWRKNDAITFDYEPGFFSVGSFSLSGDRLAAVGTYYRELPKIHLFRRVGGKWTKEREILAVDSGTHFGLVSLVGNRMLVSASKIVANQAQHRAYVYELGETDRRETIEPPFEREGAVFGGEVALGENWALINYSVAFTNGSGAIYAYRYNGKAWELKQEIRPESPMFDSFGSSMDLAGNKLLAGAPYRNERNAMAGAAFLFELVGESASEAGRWVERRKFVASDGEEHGFFGAAVALSGDTYVVSTERQDNGAAYFFDEMIRLIPQRTATGMRIVWPEKYRNARVEVQSLLGEKWRALEAPIWSESEIRGVDVAPEGGVAFYQLVREY